MTVESWDEFTSLAMNAAMHAEHEGMPKVAELLYSLATMSYPTNLKGTNCALPMKATRQFGRATLYEFRRPTLN